MAPHTTPTVEQLLRENALLRRRLTEAEEVVDAIRQGNVDAFLVQGRHRDSVYTLDTADRPYRHFVETMQDGALCLAADGAILFCNQRFADFLRTPCDTLLGRRLRQFVDDQQGPPIEPFLRHALEEVCHGEFTLLGNGARLPVHITASPLRLGDDERIYAVVSDMTPQKLHAELALKNRAISATDVGILIVDAVAADMPILFASQGFERLCGYSADEVLGRNCRFLQGPETDRRQVVRIREALRTGESIRLTIKNYRKDGRPFWNDLAISAVHDASGRLTHFVGVQNDVTAQRETQAAIEASEAKLTLGMQVAGLALAEIDYDAGMTHLSEEAARLFGLGERAVMVPRGVVHATFHPDDRAALAQRIAESLDPQGPGWFALDHRVTWPDGEIRWLRVRKQVWFEGEGADRRPRRALLAAHDVTQERHAAEAIRESEEYVRDILDSLPEQIVVLDARGVVEATNEPWERFARENGGSPLAVSIGVDYLDVCRRASVAGDPDATKTVAGLEAVLAGRQNEFVAEYPCHTPEREQWFLMYARRPQRGRAGVVLSHVDITDRKRAERELESAHQRLEESFALLDTWTARAPVGMAFLDPHGRFVRCNATLAAINGMTIDEHLGRTVEEVVPSLWESLAPLHRRALAGEPVTNVELSGETAAAPNERRHWLASYYPVHVQGRICGVGVVVVDVTAQKRIEATLKEADRRKDDFLAMLAHELRNPLAPLRNATHLLRAAEPNRPIWNDARDMIDRQVRQMVRLVDDLLDVSRVSRGKIRLRREPFELAAALQQAIDTCRPQIDERRHALFVSPPPPSVWIDGDAARLAQVVGNLLNNAAKYTDAGGTIWLSADVDAAGSTDNGSTAAGQVVIRVRDTGCGIEPELAARVFDLFYQADRDLDRADGGLGIGLSLVKSLVEMHGGRVEAASAGLGKGSEFVVRLPRLLDPPPTSVPASTTTPPRTTGLRILVVDDNRDAAQSLALLLTLHGHELRTAHDGDAALTVAADFLPRVVILDIGLPKRDGYAVARAIRGELWGRTMFLVAATGYGQSEDVRQAIDAGFDRHFVKPVDPQQLTNLLAELAETQ